VNADGGFLLLDSQGVVVSVQALAPTDELRFAGMHTWRPEAIPVLEQSGRMQEVTLPSLLRSGARQFCWILPSEDFNVGGEEWRPSAPHGGFLYTMAESEPIFFALLDPQAVPNETGDAHAHIEKAVDGAHEPGVGNGHSKAKAPPQGDGPDPEDSSERGSATCAVL